MRSTGTGMRIRSMQAALHVRSMHTAAAAGDEAKNAKNRDFDFRNRPKWQTDFAAQPSRP